MNEEHTPHQLSLLPSPEVPLQFRIDADTRRRGIAHIAEIRQVLAERQAAKAPVHELAGLFGQRGCARGFAFDSTVRAGFNLARSLTTRSVAWDIR